MREEPGMREGLKGKGVVMAGVAAAVVGAAIEALELDRSVWAEQVQEINVIITRSRMAQHVDWTAPSSGAFREALELWVRDGHDLLSLADEVIAAITAHVDALREAADALTVAESVIGDPLTIPFPGLPNPVPFGGVL